MLLLRGLLMIAMDMPVEEPPVIILPREQHPYAPTEAPEPPFTPPPTTPVPDQPVRVSETGNGYLIPLGLLGLFGIVGGGVSVMVGKR